MSQEDISRKKAQLEKMFNDISPRYDFLNHFLSMGIDRRWRNRLIRKLRTLDPETVLDVATGTGDLAIAAAKATRAHITATDIAEKMMAIGKNKTAEKGLSDRIRFMKADAEALPFEDESFDVVMVAFGVRNFTDLERGLGELYRVLRPGGKVFILEFSMPRKRIIRACYRFYFGGLLPVIGRIVSRHPDAYRYLPDSVDRFPNGDSLLKHMQNAGFSRTSHQPLSCGIASLYEGVVKMQGF